jgi:hypothetical protein
VRSRYGRDRPTTASRRRQGRASISYSVVVVTIAVGYLPWALAHARIDWSTTAPTLLLWAGAVSVVDLFFPIEWKGFTLSLSFPLLIAIGILYPPPVAAAIGVLASFDPRELRGSIKPPKAAFNRCEVGLSVLAACTVFHTLASLKSTVQVQVGATVLATVVDLVLTTILVSVYVRLESGTPVAAIRMRESATDPRFLSRMLASGSSRWSWRTSSIRPGCGPSSCSSRRWLWPGSCSMALRD